MAGHGSSMDMGASAAALGISSSSSKKVPLLPLPAKPKNEPKTYVFELELGESNDLTYPEFSWAELVRDAKAKEKSEKQKSETKSTTINPYASDDDDDLKAMAAKFEEKYGNGKPAGKKKKRREDYIDRGAGYDDTDPFIDNTDAYDELVPQDLQPAYGGFYINSGQLDFKEVQISADEDEGEDTADRSIVPKPKTASVKKASASTLDSKTPNHEVREPGEPIRKKRKVSTDTPVSRPKEIKPIKSGILDDKDGSWKSKPLMMDTEPPGNENPLTIVKTGDGTKKRPLVIKSSSSSSSSTSSSESSSSSDSDDSSSSANENQTENKNSHGEGVKKRPVLSKNKDSTKQSGPKGFKKIQANDVTMQPSSVPQRKLKVKNVPLNPNLHRNSDPLSTGTLGRTLPVLSATITPSPKLMNRKDLNLSGNNSGSPSPRTLSPSGISPVSATAIRVPTPKSVPPPALSPMGSLINSQTISSSTDLLQPKPKLKPKPKPVVLNSPEAMAQEILNSISRATMGFNHQQKAPPKLISASALKAPRTSKPLPKLQHRSGLTFDKPGGINKSSPPPPSALGKPKTLKVKEKHATTPINSAMSQAQAALQAYAAMSAGFFSPPSSSGSGVEITKLKSPHFTTASTSISPKPLPALGSGITVTEVKDKIISSGINGQPSATVTSSSMLGYGNSNIFPAHSQPSSSTNPANFSSVLVNSTSTSSTSNGNPRIPQSITITPTPLINLSTTSGDKERSDRFQFNTLGLGPTTNLSKLPTYHPFDINALLSNTTKLSLDNASRNKTSTDKMNQERK